MRIVDDEQQRFLGLALGDHAEGGEADQEDIRRIAPGDAKAISRALRCGSGS
jgi:hypothetical protein